VHVSECRVARGFAAAGPTLTERRSVMNRRLSVLIMAACLAGVVPTQADPCLINFVSHGEFRRVASPQGECLQFVDDLGTVWDVTNPRGSWTDGMTGTILAELVSGPTCSQQPGLRICTFTADFSRSVVGTLIFRDFVECPGYRIHTENEDYFITNCEDFGAELCTMNNVGRRTQAQILVNTSPSICIDSLTTVIEFRFLQ
jgi:hypothetical protein